ncbi:hypothetical protein WICMUC_005626 [Wickerhamomyces mucosus]|uniref:Acyl carrier protein n=1 Tax=Wickerhamomyces mucosus TaxID=1378264 RepID=A0A9P8P750_9ASCO|nr:hypothetical protein WICMUC_005626 [Wickerhamomyces mucosus]
MFKKFVTPFSSLARARVIRPIKPQFCSIAITTRLYSSLPPLTKELINERLLEILEGYDKIDTSKIPITPQTSFTKDLGLDSLDIVEVVMAIEEEFSIGIPEEKTDKIKTVNDALELIINDPNAV